jgi:hypothetical protein
VEQAQEPNLVILCAALDDHKKKHDSYELDYCHNLSINFGEKRDKNLINLSDFTANLE